MSLTLDHPVDLVREAAHRLTSGVEAYDPVMRLIGDARFVLLGEASHGTHEFYRSRCDITKWLISETRFNAVAVEADWPDAYRINRFVRGLGSDNESIDALGDFQRFPTWMWRNADVLDFVGWLRAYNDRLPTNQPKVGFYGLDLYSLNSSIKAVLDFLNKLDPEAAARAKRRYSCFEEFSTDPEGYGYAASHGLTESCENAVVSQLTELRQLSTERLQENSGAEEDDLFFAEQNARLVKNAEAYYRAMFRGRVSSWNLRDRHMAETLHALAAFLERKVERPKVVVWAHNSHLGDARATQMGERGEWNIGQLTRERYKRDAVLIGYTTSGGTVTAASDWDAPAERKRVQPPLEGSYEHLFHATDLPRFFLNLREPDLRESLAGPLLERAIGVIYRPVTERQSHYFEAWLPSQFDGLFHFDQTRALEPLAHHLVGTNGHTRDVPLWFVTR